jgi:DNA helicase-2/ATP-dependent DNA helicase PcrA
VKPTLRPSERFFVQGLHAQGDRHLYASRIGFIPEKRLRLFERTVAGRIG